jgi:ribonuclease BN (tRNA processing enzyme)
MIDFKKNISFATGIIAIVFFSYASYGQIQSFRDSSINFLLDSTGKTKIILLGTGTPGPSPANSGPCVAIVVNNTPYLVDLGPGVVRRAMAAYEKGIGALHVSRLKTAFITHLHSDHTLGYPDFIFTPWVVGRKGPLNVFGPPGLQEMTNYIYKAWQQDIDIRESGMEKDLFHHVKNGYLVSVHEIKPGIIYQDSNVRVKAFLVKHGQWKEAYGYRFETGTATIVISGDTSPSEALIENSKGCDVLIHEVYTEKAQQLSDSSWQKYRLKYHTSTKQLGAIAERIQPRLLVLTHQHYGVTQDPANKNILLRLSNEKDLIEEMHKYYRGLFISGHDLDIIK